MDSPKDAAEVMERGGLAAVRSMSIEDDDGGATCDDQAYALTDVGNGKRFVRDHGRNVRYCPPKRKWLVWSGTRWAWDEVGQVVELAKATARTIYEEAAACDDLEKRKVIARHAVASERAPRIAAMLEMAQSEKGIPVLPNQLDADPWLLNVSNGTLELRTGNLLRHDPSDLITRMAPVEYDPEAQSELWDDYLTTATNGDEELAAFLRRAVGYSLQGTCSLRIFFFVYGPPGGTKSTFLDVVSAALGDYHQPSDSETWLLQTHIGGNRGDLVRLAGSRLVTSVEFRKGAKFDEALLKRVTGGDPLTYSAKYEAEVSFSPACALWFAANDAPTVRDDDDGMWARTCRIPFVHCIPKEKQDPTMRARLREPEVLSAVLAWAVRGCAEWLAEGLGTCAAVDQSTADYRCEMDRAAGFFDEECVFAAGARVSKTELRKAYEGWCIGEGIKPVSNKELSKKLTDDRNCSSAKSGSTRYWEGVRLVDPLLEGGTRGTRGTSVPQNSPMQSSRVGFWENRVPAVPAVPIDDAGGEKWS